VNYYCRSVVVTPVVVAFVPRNTAALTAERSAMNRAAHSWLLQTASLDN